ncbi:YihY/virulence factor BrkB family protein [Mycoplasma sp. Mirounga ES2805-ORL]|uniref:YihY/virulence factor BrkB family protein n=1 Tax=Mycoplasma sp. Mirounga ES2805-ORL TaxID=754514 RepID=UPI00197CA942|nr:YihY/virulence factor BrkB family protein [Mycoplasma sp. Mirounga ES2805-ORL]QSF13570.1 YihY/virulence factor BrkB family protein [Mycoplasma sp. Mirounga ES2805-ORL]
MNNKQNKEILTGLNSFKIKKEYKKQIKKSSFARNIIQPDDQRVGFFGKGIKFLIMIILWIATPKLAWKNKNKTQQMIDRTYKKLTSNDIAFIPVSLAFHFLISFIPIITIVFAFLWPIKVINNSQENQRYWQLFTSVILDHIIPGIDEFTQGFGKTIKTFQENSKAGFIWSIILLLSVSLWMSSSGWAKFVYSQNYVFEHHDLGNYITNRIKGLLIVIGLSVSLTIAGLIYLFFYDVFKPFVNAEIFFYTTFPIYLFIFLYLGYSILFKTAPSFKISWSLVFPGVIVTTIPFALLTLIFPLIISQTNYKQYESWASLIYISIYIFALTHITLFGTIVNESYFKTYQSSYTVSKKLSFFSKFRF